MIVKNLYDYNNQYTITQSGIIKGKNGITIPASLGKSGYYFVNLIKDGKQVTKRVDKLVARNFVHNFNPKKFKEVIHIDGNRKNNLFKNLFWVSEKDYDKWQIHLKSKVTKKSKSGKTKTSKGLIVTDTHTNKSTTFKSPREASEQLGFTPQKIRKALRENLTINNYKFQYS